MAVKRIFLDPSRCIGCRSCVAACRECDTHKGESMIFIDYIKRETTVATLANALHALRGAVGAVRAGVSGAGDSRQPRWRRASGG